MNKGLETNKTISHYRILRKLGAGGMGEVYLALDTKLDRKVALKILPPEFAADSDRMNRFVREAKSASALNHPNIITIHEIGESEGTHFIAIEFMDGKTLTEYAKTDPLNLKSVLEIAIQIASALDEAHVAGIFHRDIKPDNVMIRPNGLVKILDFGIAKLSEKTSANISSEDATAIKPQATSPGMIVGTANYMSPEQAAGKAIDARSDIFSFGVVLYEMLSGRLPFEGETANEYIASILKSDPLPLEDKDGGLPAELVSIVRKALRKDKDARYQTMKGLLADLKELREEIALTEKLERSSVPNRIHQTENQKTLLTRAETTNQSGQVQTVSSAEYIFTEIKRHKTFSVAAIGILLLALGIGGWFLFYRSSTADAPIDSIAVLPFENRSDNADSEYLSDGLAESLIFRLSQLPNLKVSSTSSVFRYKGKEVDAQKIGNELGVRAVMSGRVIQRGDNLTIRVELIDAVNNRTIWGEQYERKMSELLATQREIAAEITNNLKLKLSGESEQKLAKQYTVNFEAYQLYLKGKFFWNKRTRESLKQATEFYKQAIEKDPNYAQAYAGLAASYIYFPNYAIASPKDSMPQAKAAAMRALELDDSLAEAHVVLGRYLTNFEWDRDGGEQELRRAIELDPNFAWAHSSLASMISKQKRFDEAIAAAKRAEEIDPLELSIAVTVAERLFEARRFDESISQAKKLLSLDPNYPNTHHILGRAYFGKGLYQESITSFQKYGELSGSPSARVDIAFARAKLGHRDEAAKLLDWLKQESSERYVPNEAFAITYIALGQKDEAFVWLEKGVTDRTSFASSYAIVPALDDVRDDPRFKAMLKRMNLPE